MYRVNLIPVEKKERLNIRRLLGVLLIIFILAGVGFSFFYQRLEISSLENQIAAVERELQTLAPMVRQAEELQQEINRLEDQIFYDEIFYPRTSLVETIKEFSHLMTDHMNLNNFNLEHGGELTISGQTRDHEKVSMYMDNLDGSPYFNNVNLVESSSTWDGDGFRRTVFYLNVRFKESGVEQ